MRILFDLQRAGYLRLYESSLRILVERGHDIALGVRQMGDGELAGLPERVSVSELRPRRRDLWAPLAEHLRQTVDYARYLDARLEADYLRARTDQLPPLLTPVRRLRKVPPTAMQALLRLMLALERAVPSSREVEELIRSAAPDVVVMTPLVKGLEQTDLVKSARSLGVPSVLAVASWDHLTTKGLIRAQPDRVLVWNGAQSREATDLHLVPPERVTVTGAQPWDWWFYQRPSTERSEFCRRVGLEGGGPFVLFAGSSSSITEPVPEYAFVLRWIRALRQSEDVRLHGIGVLVRPHPTNGAWWGTADPPAERNVAVWPRHGGHYARSARTKSDYFDSLFHSAAVVGINTSAMMEAAIIGRPVLTVDTGEFADTQAATLHFRHLLPEHGGFVLRATTLEGHAAELAAALEDPEASAAGRARFVGSFVRPQGADLPSAPRVADAIEAAARDGAGAEDEPLGVLALRALLLPIAVALRYGDRDERSRVLRRGGRRARRQGRRVRVALGRLLTAARPR